MAIRVADGAVSLRQKLIAQLRARGVGDERGSRCCPTNPALQRCRVGSLRDTGRFTGRAGAGCDIDGGGRRGGSGPDGGRGGISGKAALAERLMRLDPGARVGGNTQVSTVAGALVVGVASRTNFIMGLASRQRIVGGRGHDQLGARGSATHVLGGRGHDLIHGMRGSQRLTGGPGRDHHLGGPGGDRLEGGHGDDRLVDKQGPTFVVTGRGENRVDVADGDGDELVLCTLARPTTSKPTAATGFTRAAAAGPRASATSRPSRPGGMPGRGMTTAGPARHTHAPHNPACPPPRHARLRETAAMTSLTSSPATRRIRRRAP